MWCEREERERERQRHREGERKDQRKRKKKERDRDIERERKREKERERKREREIERQRNREFAACCAATVWHLIGGRHRVGLAGHIRATAVTHRKVGDGGGGARKQNDRDDRHLGGAGRVVVRAAPERNDQCEMRKREK